MRRREPPRPDRPGGEVPLWLRQLNYGFQHVAEQDPGVMARGDGLGEVYRKLRAERARWCAENGCYRQGKTCVEAFGAVPDACRSAGGQESA